MQILVILEKECSGEDIFFYKKAANLSLLRGEDRFIKDF